MYGTWTNGYAETNKNMQVDSVLQAMLIAMKNSNYYTPKIVELDIQ